MMLKSIYFLGFLHTFVQSYTFYAIGIYSICSSSSINKTQLNIDAALMNKTIDSLITDLRSYYLVSAMIEYEAFDVCNDYTSLSKLIETILLDRRYELHQKYASFSDSVVMATYSHLSPFLKNHLLQSLSMTQIPNFYIDVTEKSDGSFFVSDLETYVKDLTNLTNYFYWNDVFLVSITTDTDLFPYHVYYKMAIEALQKKSTCLHYVIIKPSELNSPDVFTLSWLQGRSPAVVLFGRAQYQKAALRRLKGLYGKTRISVVTHDVSYHATDYENGIYRPRHINLFDMQRMSYGDDRFFINKELKLSAKTTDILSRFTGNLMYSLDSILWITDRYVGLMRARRQSYKNKEYLVFTQLRDYQIKKWSESGLLDNQQYYIYSEEYDYDKGHAHELFKFSNRAKFRSSSCPNTFCGPGYFKVYGDIGNSGFGWKCVLCPENHVKKTMNESKCQPCTGIMNIDNGYRTKCVDPYTLVIPDLLTIEFLVAIFTAMLGFLFTVVTMVTFTVKKRTPIVLTSDYTVSMIHQMLFLCIYGSTLVPYFKHPSLFTCLWKPLIASIFYTINVGIVFVKSLKLVQAFLSRIRITANEARRTVSTQFFIIVIFTVCSNALFALTMTMEKPGVVEFRYKETMTRIHLCNTAFHTNSIMGLVLTLQLMCLIQAFRGRNLPTVMNDGILLAYATFIVTLVLIIMFAIVPFQPEEQKELFQSLAILINTSVVWLILYGQKCFRMLIYPEQNTGAYFREQRMKGVQQNVNSAMGHSQL